VEDLNMQRNMGLAQRARYLARIVGGLALVVGLLGGGVWLHVSDWPAAIRLGALAGVVILTLAIFPLVQAVYRRMDELEQRVHEKASTASLPLLACLAAAIGVLQAQGVVPLFNLLWIFGAVVAVWAVGLVCADRAFK
jgi:hypothetical protein